MRRSAPSSAQPCFISTPAMPHIATLGARRQGAPRRLGAVCASRTPPIGSQPLPVYWTGRGRRAHFLAMGSRVRHTTEGAEQTSPQIGDAKRSYPDGKGLDGGRSAGIRRRQRTKRDGILWLSILQDDENGNGSETSNNGRLGQSNGRGDVPDDLIEIVVVEEAELPGGVGGAGIRQRSEREEARDEKQHRPVQRGSCAHCLSRYYPATTMSTIFELSDPKLEVTIRVWQSR